MEQKKKESNLKSSLSIRIIGGAYLIYNVFMLIRGYGDLEGKDRIVITVFIGLFGIIGTLFLTTGIRSWIKMKKEEEKEEILLEKEFEDIKIKENVETAENTKRSEVEDSTNVARDTETAEMEESIKIVKSAENVNEDSKM